MNSLDEEMDIRILTLTSYGNTEDEIVRITIAAENVAFLIASSIDVIKFGQRLRKVNVFLMAGPDFEIFISDLDLTTLERAVGTYMLP